MTNKSVLLRFGGLTFAVCGELPDGWEREPICRFVISEGAADIRVTVARTDGLHPLTDAVLLRETETLRAYRRGETGLLLYRAMRAECGRDYALLTYPLDRPTELTLTICDRAIRFDTTVLFGSMMLETLLLHFGRGILHASFISHAGQAIAFTAPCGTGKSTQAELWRRYRGAEIINGDKTVLAELDGVEYACGLPLCGTSEICRNRNVPLRAVVLLRQGKENEIRRLRGAQAVKALLEQLYLQPWNARAAELALELSARVCCRVPVFLLRCLPDVSAVECLENALQGEE